MEKIDILVKHRDWLIEQINQMEKLHKEYPYTIVINALDSFKKNLECTNKMINGL